MKATNRDVSRVKFASKSTSGGTLRLLKWLVIIALLVLILMAIFLPDRSLAAPVTIGSQDNAHAGR